MRCTSATPGSVRRLRWWKESMSPTSPMIVRVTPLLTNASPPTPSTRDTTPAMSSSVAPGAITITTGATLGHRRVNAVTVSAIRTRPPHRFVCAAERRKSHGSADESGSSCRSDRQVGDFALDVAPGSQLDDEHGGDHEDAAEEHPGGERLAAEEDGEE